MVTVELGAAKYVRPGEHFVHPFLINHIPVVSDFIEVFNKV